MDVLGRGMHPVVQSHYPGAWYAVYGLSWLRVSDSSVDDLPMGLQTIFECIDSIQLHHC